MISNLELQGVMRAANRYYLASLQDKSEVVGYLHASYALIILEIALRLAPRDRIKKVTGFDWDKLMADTTKSQDHFEKILVSKFGRSTGKALSGYTVIPEYCDDCMYPGFFSSPTIYKLKGLF
jgi:hypothetical protein